MDSVLRISVLPERCVTASQGWDLGDFLGQTCTPF